MKDAIQSRLDKYNKDNNNITDENKNNQNFKSKSSKSINVNVSSLKNGEKTSDNIDSKFSVDKEVLLAPYYKDNEKNEKKNEDSTKDCLTINKLLVHPFYSEIQLTESFLKFLFNTEKVEKDKKKSE